MEVEDGGREDGSAYAIMGENGHIDPSGQANEGEDIEFIVDDLEREDWRARVEEQVFEEDEEDDDVLDVLMPEGREEGLWRGHVHLGRCQPADRGIHVVPWGSKWFLIMSKQASVHPLSSLCFHIVLSPLPS